VRMNVPVNLRNGIVANMYTTIGPSFRSWYT